MKDKKQQAKVRKGKELKIIKVEGHVHMSETEYLYVLAEDGCYYYGGHDPKNNSIIWKKIPSPIKSLRI